MTAKDLKAWILQLAGVTEAPHRFGGTEFRFQNMEFMHSHGPTYLDIHLSKEDQERVLREGKAQHHRASLHHEAGWVTFRIRSERELEAAKELVQLAYDNTGKLLASHSGRGRISSRAKRLTGLR